MADGIFTVALRLLLSPLTMKMVSPFAQILHTNHVPSERETLEIKEFLAEPEQELAQIDDQIDSLENVIHGLMNRRDVLRETVDPHRAILSPFRRLPKDIVQEIFLACLPTSYNAAMTRDEAPLLLCRVSRGWREFAQSFPLLWSTLHIPVGLTHYGGAVQEMPARLFPALCATVDRWLGRSSGCPLSLSVKCYPDHTAPVSAEFLEHMMMWSSRWRSLTLDGGRSVEDFLAVHRSADAFPMLEELDISHHTQIPQDAATWGILRAPALRRVSLKVQVIDPFGLTLPWEQLTQLDLNCDISWMFEDGNGAQGLKISSAVELLHKCHRLEHCSLHVAHYVSTISVTSMTAQLDFLRSLELYQSYDATELLEHLTMPSLRVFGLYPHEKIPRAPANFSVKSMVKGPPGVEELMLFLRMITLDSLIDTLTLLSSVTDLHLVGYPPPDIDSGPVAPPFGAVFDDEMLARLTPSSSSDETYLCPRLEYLVLEEMSGLSDDALFRFIKARAASAHPLKYVRAEFMRRREWDMLPFLEPYMGQDDGLRVSLRYSIPLGRGYYDPTV
ncbi:hypothetical protein C8R47DRAFT_1243045 [Mycena vitilis]|nr:hypothetical protein C8R47DRAFT_1243045 [Mycena vitilis]